MSFETIYERLPRTAQDAACSLEGWRIQRSRYNADFWEKLRSAEARLSLGIEGMEQFRNARLAAFVHHAATTTTYYRRLFAELGAEAGDFRTLKDLASLPVLTKSDVQADPEAFVSEAVPASQRVLTKTSGTTGGGLKFYTTPGAQREQFAIWWRYYRSHGIQPGTWCAYFGGRTIVPLSWSSPPFWRVNVPGRQILFSTYHAHHANLTLYLEELRRRRPPWLHGYPSYISLLASHIVETGFDLGYRPSWITTGAENLFAHQEAAITRGFGVKPMEHYGMVEAAANASRCPHGNLHVDEDFAAVEFLPRDGHENLCEVIGTNMSNPATPLLRYNVQDQASMPERPCACGHPGRTIAAVDGRIDDSVLLANGEQSGPLDHIFKDLTTIREAQFRQRGPGDIRVLIVRSSRFTREDGVKVRAAIADRLGDQARVDVEYVDRIERSRTGKLRFVVDDRA